MQVVPQALDGIPRSKLTEDTDMLILLADELQYGKQV